MAKRAKKPKSILRLPDLDYSKSAVLNSLPSLNSRRSYEHAIGDFIEWYCSEPRLAFNKTVVTRYRIALEQRRYAPSTINLRLAAVRRLAYEASDCGLLSPDLAAGIRRVKGAKRLGVRVGNWLTVEQGKKLLAVHSGKQLRDLRNHAVLAMLLGCGLRRAELVAVRIEDFELREEHWVLADLIGKGPAHARDPCAVLGEGDCRCVDRRCGTSEWQYLPRHRQDRKDSRLRFHRQGSLVHRSRSGFQLRHRFNRTTRSAAHVCSPLPPVGRRIGTNSISAWSCIDPDDRALSWVQATAS
jgi:integrase